MTDFSSLLQQGSAHAWLFIPSAILLGALHGLEPGHSKTMMAAFIVAVRGTIPQAVLLGLSAAVSHSLVVWAVAATGLAFGEGWSTERLEPLFQMVSALAIAAMAAWMFLRTRKDLAAAERHRHEHGHEHHHHDHGDHDHGHHHHRHVETDPDPITGEEYEDDHEKALAYEIEQRFAGRPATTGQIVLFGLSGGLIPCPASITVLLICLQLKKLALGFTLVLAFSAGLALTLVTTGALAAWSVHHARKHFKGFGSLARRAPYVSVVILSAVAAYVGVNGFRGWMALRGQ